MEQSQTMQLALLILSTYVFILFAGWWIYMIIHKGGTTMLYKITCFMFLGLSISHFGAWYMYDLVSQGYNPEVIMNMKCWHMKGYFVLLPILFYAIHITNRIINGKPRRCRHEDD